MLILVSPCLVRERHLLFVVAVSSGGKLPGWRMMVE